MKKEDLMIVGDVEVQRKNSILAVGNVPVYNTTAISQILEQVRDSLVIIYDENGEYQKDYSGVIFVTNPGQLDKIGNEILSGDNRNVWIFITGLDKIPAFSALIPLFKTGIKFFVSVENPDVLAEIYGQSEAEVITRNFTKLIFEDEKDEEDNVAVAELQEAGWGMVTTNLAIHRP